MGAFTLMQGGQLDRIIILVGLRARSHAERVLILRRDVLELHDLGARLLSL